MALIWTEGFDHWTDSTNNTGLYTNIVASTTAVVSRTGGRSFVSGNYGNFLTKIAGLPAHGTMIFGFAVFHNASNANIDPLVSLTSNGIVVGELLGQTQNKWLRYSRRDSGTSTTLGTTSNFLLTNNVWLYIELKVTIHSSTGTVEVKINGSTVLNLTNQNTQSNHGSAASGTVDGFVISSNTTIGNGPSVNNGTFSYIDDFYVCNGSGSTNNNFLGDIKVLTLLPNGAGSSTQFTPSTGSNWQNVDETLANGDTDHNSSSTAGHQDLYALSDLTGSPTVYGIHSKTYVRKTDAGARDVKLLTRTNSTTYAGSANALSTSYQWFSEVREQNPNTSAAWTASNINALESGVEVV